ncbi:hypothetical protein SAMN05443572_103104 [Myxococcus fulvus]|nr:hypothetical protein MFUL124B02_24665 [Myxococcus fulvus 124B02]SET76063.1 hypothetical protein SAMN05443572_103104 [Myxococcus fulvus]
MNALHAHCPEFLRPLWEQVAETDTDEEVLMYARQSLRD